MNMLVDESVEEHVQFVSEQGEVMDVSEEIRLLRAAALNSRNLTPPGPGAISLSLAPGGLSLSVTGAPPTSPATGTGSVVSK